MIELKDVTRRFGQKTVLEHLSHQFPSNGIVSLMGPSGLGKTTLLRLLAGLDKPDSGEVINTFVRPAVCFQEPRLIPWMNCLENITFVLPKSNSSSEKAREILKTLELDAVANALPSTLSGGMRQRISLARALAFDGDLLLLDEPFSALDKALKTRIAPLIRQANRNGLTVVITHDPEDARLLGAEILRLEGDPVHSLLSENK